MANLIHLHLRLMQGVPHTYWMQRCIQLAGLAVGHVAPNPLVGAVLVYGDRIIGEGYHQVYGQAHAEVNCIASVQESDRELIQHAVMYVSLEPCAHFGKTPPCADLIIRHRIPTVVIGCRDPFAQVDGKGIEKLQAAGVEVITGVLEDECRVLNKRFFTFHTQQRPYIILKWAQTGNGLIGYKKEDKTIPAPRLLISNEYTNRLVHRWRSEEAGILVGTNTALQDDPALTNRLWSGPSPVRLVIDMQNRLPAHLRLFDQQQPTIVFNGQKEEQKDNVSFYKIDSHANIITAVTAALYQLNIQSVLVEGGAQLLQSFIDAGIWDEARVIINPALTIADGVAAPVLTNHKQTAILPSGTDEILLYKKDDQK